MPTPKVQSTIHANGVDISVVSTVGNEDDYISLTDSAKYHKPRVPRICHPELDEESQYNRVLGAMGKTQ